MQSNFSSKLQSKLHVGIIMDGNGRWATRRGLSRLRGHEAGVEAIRRVVEAAPQQGVGTLTLYAFSSDNWRRPRAEVTALMALLRFYLASEVESLVRNGVRLTPRSPPRRHRNSNRARRSRHSERRCPASAHRRRLFSPRCDPQCRCESCEPRQSHPGDIFRTRHRRRRASRRRPRDPDQRREAVVRLPAVGERLRRIAFHRTDVAGFWVRRSRGSVGVVPSARTPVWRLATGQSRASARTGLSL
jgi:hypothetical protein